MASPSRAVWGSRSNAPDFAALEHDEKASRLGCALLQASMAPPPILRQAVESVGAAAILVLVVSGGWSPVFDITSQVVARLLAGRHAIVASPNHFPQLANAGEFNRVVDEFMRAAEAGGLCPATP